MNKEREKEREREREREKEKERERERKGEQKRFDNLINFLKNDIKFWILFVKKDCRLQLSLHIDVIVG
jgi:hypothetical protein